MLGGALKVTPVPIDNVVLVVLSPLRFWNFVVRTVNLVRCSSACSTRLPLNVLEVIRTVNDADTVATFHHFLGDGIINVTCFGIQIVQLVGHLLQHL